MNEDIAAAGSLVKDLRAEREGKEDLPKALRKEPRTCVKSLPYEISNFLTYERVSTGYKTILTNLSETVIPKKVGEALRYPHWRNAIDEEMWALLKNETWEAVERPKDKKLVGCRWIFTIQYKSDGPLERYKAILVATGYT